MNLPKYCTVKCISGHFPLDCPPVGDHPAAGEQEEQAAAGEQDEGEEHGVPGQGVDLHHLLYGVVAEEGGAGAGVLRGHLAPHAVGQEADLGWREGAATR